MPQTPEGPDPKSDRYEAPEVEEIPTDGPVSTAPDGTVTQYPSVSLIRPASATARCWRRPGASGTAPGAALGAGLRHAGRHDPCRSGRTARSSS
jgi:hypothetical protein